MVCNDLGVYKQSLCTGNPDYEKKMYLVHYYFKQFLKPFQTLLMYKNAELQESLPPGPVGQLTVPPRPPAAFGMPSACTQAALVTRCLP